MSPAAQVGVGKALRTGLAFCLFHWIWTVIAIVVVAGFWLCWLWRKAIAAMQSPHEDHPDDWTE